MAVQFAPNTRLLIASGAVEYSTRRMIILHLHYNFCGAVPGEWENFASFLTLFLGAKAKLFPPSNISFVAYINILRFFGCARTDFKRNSSRFFMVVERACQRTCLI